MNRFPPRRLWLVVPLLVTPPAQPAARAGEVAGWKKGEAAKYLDGRARAWFAYPAAGRGEGPTKASCVSCHTLLPYALARPVLRKMAGTAAPTDYEKRLLDQTRRRVAAWADRDAPTFGLLYDFSARKKKESRGTEAVLNAVILAFDDRYQGRTAPGDATRRAFDNLWEVQARAGADRGSWDWLDFGLEPWESKGARYCGAALAAVAVGAAPGYYRAGADEARDGQVGRLRGYLRGQFAGQNLHNRAWALWASRRLGGVLPADEQKRVVRQLLARQRGDGGWSLPSLGAFARGDGTPQEASSDGYATGLVLHVLQEAGVARGDPQIARGLAWLRGHQGDDGGWRGVSVNKKRDPATHAGRFMSDAATAFAVLALGH